MNATKKLPLVMTVIIFAAIAVCFLHPKCGSMEIEVTPFETTVVELSGADADRFELRVRGRQYGSRSRFMTGAEIAVSSTDGGYYTLGEQVWWSNGHGDGNYVLGYVERLVDGEWQPYYTLYDCTPRAEMFSGRAYDFIPPKEKFYDYNNVNLPCWEPGHYRATFFARDYIPRDVTAERHYINCYGHSGGETYEFGFEYDVPERSDEPFDVLFANVWRNERYAWLALTLRKNTAAMYVQLDSMRLERYDEQSGKWVDTGNKLARLNYRLADDFLFMVEWENRETAENVSALSEHGDDYRLDLMPLPEIALGEVEQGGKYRLKMTLAADPDGSGEQYTLALRMQFGE